MEAISFFMHYPLKKTPSFIFHMLSHSYSNSDSKAFKYEWLKDSSPQESQVTYVFEM